jgi:hypothetical protein
MSLHATLFLIVGLPGAGKTTRARELEEAHRALRFSPDEWMIPLFGESDADGKRDLLEGLLINIPADVGHAVWDLTRRVAVAMRETFGCEGISTRQHNEPAGDQDVWHMHVHVFARKRGDQLYRRHGEASFVPPQERAPWADRLRDRLSNVTVTTRPTTQGSSSRPGVLVKLT